MMTKLNKGSAEWNIRELNIEAQMTWTRFNFHDT